MSDFHFTGQMMESYLEESLSYVITNEQPFKCVVKMLTRAVLIITDKGYESYNINSS